MSDIHLPDGVLLDIITRVGKRNFRDLRPFLLAGRRGRDAVYSADVLKKANISEFLSATNQIMRGKPCRAFFIKCVHVENEFATLLEGLRLAFHEGELDLALAVLQTTEITFPFTVYVLGMLWICAGSHLVGTTVLRAMKWWEDVEQFNLLGMAVEGMIQGLEPTMKSTFQQSFNCPEPSCLCEKDNLREGCVLCCVYKNAYKLMLYS